MPCYTGKTSSEIMEDVWPPLEQLKDYLGDKLFLTGDSLVWLDFYFFELCMYLDYLSGEVVLKFYANLASYVERIQKLDKFAEVWNDDDKTIKWPWNLDMCPIGSRSSQL